MCNYFYGEDLERLIKKANIFAGMRGLSIPDAPIGDGTCGIVFKVKDGLMLKVTTSINEFIAALKLKDNQNPYLIDVYEAEDLGDYNFGILMEEVEVTTPKTINPENYKSNGFWNEHSVMERIFHGVDFACQKFRLSIRDFDDGHLTEVQRLLSDDEFKMFVDLRESVAAFRECGVFATDTCVENVGQRTNGKYVFFDQEFEIMGFENHDYKKMIEKMTEKSLKNIG